VPPLDDMPPFMLLLDCESSAGLSESKVAKFKPQLPDVTDEDEPEDEPEDPAGGDSPGDSTDKPATPPVKSPGKNVKSARSVSPTRAKSPLKPK
jgi:hypothetical protein